jgi:hypothetical protein
MKRLIQLFTCVLVITAFFSCKKDKGTSPGNSTLISKFVKLDTTQAIPGDTVSIYSYTYDNEQRINSVSRIYYNNGIPDSTTLFRYDLYYNGNSKLINEQVVTDFQYGLMNGSVASIDYYAYDISGRLTEDSTSYNLLYKYTYSNTYLVCNTTIRNFPNPERIITDTVFQTSLNGDITSQIDTANFNISNERYILDNHPNPLAVNGLGKQAIYNIGFITGEQKNNYVEIDGISAGAIQPEAFYQYTYRPNGYPASVIKREMGIYSYTGIYIYQ